MNTRTDDEDHEQLADQLEEQADEMSERSRELQDEIKSTRGDWDAKRRDDGAVGTPPSREGS